MASKYTDLPVFLLNSEQKYWQNSENTEKLGRLCTYCNTVYGASGKILKKLAKY